MTFSNMDAVSQDVFEFFKQNIVRKISEEAAKQQLHQPINSHVRRAVIANSTLDWYLTKILRLW